jgi:hypothetical protein
VREGVERCAQSRQVVFIIARRHQQGQRGILEEQVQCCVAEMGPGPILAIVERLKQPKAHEIGDEVFRGG